MRAVVLGALLLPLPLAAQALDSVTLRFAWPATYRVTARITTMGTSPMVSADSALRVGRMRIHVQPHAEGLIVTHDSVSAADFAPPASAVALDGIGQMSGSFVVSREGRFLRARDISGLQATMDSLYARVTREAGGAVPRRIATMFSAMRTDSALTASLADVWDDQVGVWAGSRWVIGVSRDTIVTRMVPLAPGRAVPTTYTMSVARRLPCTERSDGDDCVELVLRGVPDMVDVIEAMVLDMVEEAGGNRDAVFALMPEMKIEREVRIVAEPSTLVLHRIDTRARTSMKTPEAAEFTLVDDRMSRMEFTSKP